MVDHVTADNELLCSSVGIGVAISLTATNLIVERASGLFDRSYVAGIQVQYSAAISDSQGVRNRNFAYKILRFPRDFQISQAQKITA